VLLVSLGLIDLGFYTGPAETAANLRRFLAEARAARPGVRVAVLPVIPNVRAVTDAPFRAQVAELNALMAEAVHGLTTPASPLVLAEPPRDWDLAADTYDGTHPSPRGEHRLAAAFAAALHTAWGLGGPYTPVTEAAEAVA
jgi:lysophospholipase L1-like esterase